MRMALDRVQYIALQEDCALSRFDVFTHMPRVGLRGFSGRYLRVLCTYVFQIAEYADVDVDELDRRLRVFFFRDF